MDRLLISQLPPLQWVPRPSRLVRRAGIANADSADFTPPDRETKSRSILCLRSPARLPQADSTCNCSIATAPVTPPTRASPDCDACISASPSAFSWSIPDREEKPGNVPSVTRFRPSVTRFRHQVSPTRFHPTMQLPTHRRPRWSSCNVNAPGYT